MSSVFLCSKGKVNWLVTPTLLKLELFEDLPSLDGWLQRIRMESDTPVEFTCTITPKGDYAQYKFIRGQEAGFAAQPGIARVEPGGKGGNAVVEGVISNNRFYAIRMLELSGELVYGTVSENFFNLEVLGFDVPEYRVCYEKGSNPVLLFCNHVNGYKNSYPVQGVLITTSDQRFRDTRAYAKCAPSPDVIYVHDALHIRTIEELEEVKSAPVATKPILKFDFVGKFPKGIKDYVHDCILSHGHFTGNILTEDVNYVVCAESMLDTPEASTAKILSAREKGVTLVSAQFVLDLLGEHSPT